MKTRNWLSFAAVVATICATLGFIRATMADAEFNRSPSPLTSSDVPVSLANGGAGKALTASNGGVVYTDADSLEVLSGTATAGQVLRSGTSAAPSWSTATYPATCVANELPYCSATNVFSGLTSAASAVLTTNGSSVPALSQQMLMLAGTAGAPTFGYGASTNTGLYFTSAPSVRIAVAGSAKLIIDGSGVIVNNTDFTGGAFQLTAGTMTASSTALIRKVIHKYSWTNAMVTALPTTAGDIVVATLPAKTVVTNAYVVLTGAAVGPTTVTVAVGRTSATYIDYIVASDAKAAANTVYGDASAERGTNLTGYDLPSYTATTAINAHFISTGADLSTVTGSTGVVYVETLLLP